MTSPKPYFTTIISVPELVALQASNQPHMIFDCSFDLAKPDAGYAAYLESHIAGAVYANLDTDLSEKSETRASTVGMGKPASGGRHPLPSRKKFAAWLSSIGFTNDTQAVVYDRNNTMIAGRLWWMLKWIGHDKVAVLDGGFPAWQAVQANTSKGAEPVKPASQYQQGLQGMSLVDASEVTTKIGSLDTAILDARAAPRYRGEVEPLDPVAGHIPSALNRPFTNNFDESGCFKSANQLRKEFDVLLAGRDPAQTVHHCGSGVSAIPNVLAMAVAGFGLTTLYAGSWSDWCSDSSRPIAQG